MRKWSIETLSLVGTGAVLTLLIVLGGMACHDMRRSRGASQAVDRIYDRVAWLERVRADLYQVHDAQVHFSERGDSDSKRQSEVLNAALGAKLAQGPQLADDNPASRQRLLALEAWFLQQTGIALEQSGAMIDGVIAAERTLLELSKQVETACNQRSRRSLAVLLLTLALLISYILLKIRSVTISRQAAHLLLQGKETRYRHIVDTAHEGIWLTDAESRIVFANERMTEMMACAMSDLIGRLVSDFMPETVLQRCCPLERREDVSMRDLRYRRADGTEAWAMVSGRLLRGERGEIGGALVMMTDITERKLAEQALATAHAELEDRIGLRTTELVDANKHLRAEIEVRKLAEQALAQSELRLQEIISMMPLALFLKDPDSRVMLMNEACEQQWGISFAELDLIGESAYFPAEQLAGFIANDKAAFASGRQLVDEEQIWNAKLQENRQVQTYKRPIFDADGKPLMLIAMSIDITERKRNEEALRHSFTQLRALSDHQETIKEEERKRIALDIHDDLGQNLMALKIDVSMLHARTGGSHPRLNGQVRRVLDTIDTTIKSVRGIINDLHPSTLELGLCAAVEWLLKQFERRSAIDYRLIVLDDRASASLDQRQTSAIFRVIQESLANIVRHAEASKVEVTLDLNPAYITVTIADNGIGMQPGDRGKAASYGLKSIKERIGAFGGELVIDSRKGKGTVLSILMPTAQETRKAPLAPALETT
ncbi:two-component system sensor histidine kinase UhpB [Oxalobacteraceae bacterium GrIS 1.11]